LFRSFLFLYFWKKSNIFLKTSLYIIIIFFTILSCSRDKEPLPAKTQQNDSVGYYLSLAAKPNLDAAKKTGYNRKALVIIEPAKQDSSRIKGLYQIANNFFILQQMRDFKLASAAILNQALKAKDTSNVAKAYVYLGEYYKSQKKTDSAFSCFSKAEKYYKPIKDYPNLADLYVRKATLLGIENDFFGSEKAALEALTILRAYPNNAKTYEAYNLIGICSNELNNYEKAIEYFTRALNIVHKLTNVDQTYYRGISLNNIGNAYQNAGNYSLAIRNYQLALQQNKVKTDYKDLYGILLDNLAYSKFKSKDLRQLPDLFFESLNIHTQLNYTSRIVLSKIHISEYFASVDNMSRAVSYAEEALALAKIEKFPGDVLVALKQLSAVDNEKSTVYSNQYIKINDSLQKAERLVKERFARIQYETDEILLENDELAAQNRSLLYFFVGTLMIGVLLFVIRAQRSKNRELLLKQAQQKANEDIYNLMISQQNKIEESRIREKKRIAQELHDGVLGRLFGARLNLDSLNRTSSEDAIKKRNDYLSELKNIEQDIREISHDLNREKYVLINNFIAILNNLLEEQRASFNMALNVTVDDAIQWELLGNTAKINLYRIIQESLQNINKYAGATKVQVSIKKADDNIVLSVTDNGNGFAVSTKKKGIGLQNMISRTHELNGIFDIRSKKGAGTSVIVTFPIETKQTIIA
jgi:signal transduction histidine kinase